MPDTSQTYRDIFTSKLNLYEKKAKRLFTQIANDMSVLVNDPDSKFISGFDFDYQNRLKAKINVIMAKFHDEYSDMLQQQAKDCWDLSNQKNDKMIARYVRNISFLAKTKEGSYYNHNTDALKAFLKSEKNFSDSVWKITKQYQRELEMHLGLGIMNGDSANVVSQRIRQYLKNPDTLFRRVRDKKGNLVLSSNAKEFNPGQGVYRSAYKNAVRLTRTTNNMAFLEADYNRWNQIDFVIGVQVSLSASHRIYDICDLVQGTYPKTFKFVGWHPQCMCNATPILMPQDDFERQLAGEKVDIHYIKNVPDGFNNWISDNTDRVNGWKNIPYFIRDNFNGGTISGGLRI